MHCPNAGERSISISSGRVGVILLFGKYLKRPINRICGRYYDQFALPLSISPFTPTRLRTRNGTIKKQPLLRDFQSSSLLELWPSLKGEKPQDFWKVPRPTLPLSNSSPLIATRLRTRNGMIKKHPLVRDFQSSSFLALWPSLKVTNLVQDLWLERTVTWDEVWMTRISLQTPPISIKSQSPGKWDHRCVFVFVVVAGVRGCWLFLFLS